MLERRQRVDAGREAPATTDHPHHEDATDMKLEEMVDAEKRALAALVRVMVGVDGEYSAAESAGLAKTADYLGEEEFWQLLNEVGHQHLDEGVLEDWSRTVERPEAREAIYGILFGIAAAGSIVDDEGKMLDWLAETWELKTEAEPET